MSRVASILLLSTALSAAGCALTPNASPPAGWNADAKLAWWLDAWLEGRGHPRAELEPHPAPAEDADASADEEEGEENEGPRIPPWVVRAGLRQLALEYPRHVPTLVANGALSLTTSDHHLAQQWLEEALTLDPTHVEAGVLLARVAVDAGNLVGARRTLQRLLLVRPDAAQARETLAGVLYLQGETERAELELQHAARLGGESARLAYHRGLLAERAGDLQRAAAWYRQAVDADPRLERAWHRLQAVDAGSNASR